MAQGSTLYRFKLAISDIDRGVYDSVDLRMAMHPSETVPFLLTRVIAYALHFESGLEFSEGLCAPDDPAIRLLGAHGQIARWIDIGNPSARRLHKASKASDAVFVYTYKDPEGFLRELGKEPIHRREAIRVFSLGPEFITALGGLLKRDNAWTVIHNDGELVVGAGDQTVLGTIQAHSLEPR